MYTSVDISVEDVYNSLSDCDKYELLDWLTEDGITEYSKSSEQSQITLMKESWTETCIKLNNLYYRMSNEEQLIIEKIVKKYL